MEVVLLLRCNNYTVSRAAFKILNSWAKQISVLVDFKCPFFVFYKGHKQPAAPS